VKFPRLVEDGSNHSNYEATALSLRVWHYIAKKGLPALCLLSSLLALVEPQSCHSAVIAWGDNTYGQTNVPSDLGDVRMIASGERHCVALQSDGTVRTWGSHSGTNVPPGISNIVAVAAGDDFTIVLDSQGVVQGWGNIAFSGMNPSNMVAISACGLQAFGMTKDGGVEVLRKLAGSTPPEGLGNVTWVSAGYDNDLAVRSDGSVVGWGANSSGQLKIPAALTNAVAAAAARSAPGAALCADGTILTWGNWYPNKPPTGLSNVVAIAAGRYHTLALKLDGSVVSWGSSTNVPARLSGVTQIAAGNLVSLALISSNAPMVSTPLTDHPVLPGGTAQFYVQGTGEWPLTYQWYCNETNLPTATNCILSVGGVSLGHQGSYMCMISNGQGAVSTSSASVSMIPLTEWGVPLTPTNLASCPTSISGLAIAPSRYASVLRTDKKVFSFGLPSPPDINSRTNPGNVKAVANGKDCAIALMEDGTVQAWRLSLLPNPLTNLPPGLSNVQAVAATTTHALALLSNMTVAAWGNGSGTWVPAGATNLVQVSCGDGYTLGLKSDGSMAGWGFVQPPSGITGIVRVTGGFRHSLALRGDGTVLAWGDNSTGQTNVPTDLSNVVSIAAGRSASAALKADGTVVAWGQNSNGRSNVPVMIPSGLSNVTAIALSQDDYGLALSAAGAPVLETEPFTTYAFPGAAALFTVMARGEWPLTYQWQYNGTNIPGANKPWLQITNVQFPDAGDYSVTVSNLKGVATSRTATLTVPDFGPALNQTNFSWSSFGDSIWFAQTNYTHDGSLALQSGSLTNAALHSVGSRVSSTLRTVITGPGTLTFLWKSSGPSGWQYLRLLVDSIVVAQISGEVDWQKMTNYVGAGSHTIDWKYDDYYFGALAGQNAGFVDEVSFVPGTTGPILLSSPPGFSQAPGADANFSVSATGTPPLNYQWQFNGVEIPAATNSSLTVSNVGSSNVGMYRAQVGNSAGSLESDEANFVLGRIASAGPRPAPPDITNAIALASGYHFNLALQQDGTISAWGENCCGQTNVPASLTDAVAVACGSSFALGLTSNGNVTAWGDNSAGQTQIPTGLSNVVAIAAGSTHAMALKNDGSVSVWGNTNYALTTVPANLSNVVAISARQDHCIALTAGGDVFCWGNNYSGMSTVPSTLTNVVAIAAAGYVSFALRDDDKLVAWGESSYNLTNFANTLPKVFSIAGGIEHAVAVLPDGTAVGWGNSDQGATRIPPTLSNVVSVAADASQTLLLVGDAPPTRVIPIENFSLTNGQFQVSVKTESGRTYRLEYASSLQTTVWTPLPLAAGNSRTLVLVDPSANSSQRFYRVKRW
jgi:alpha-tubulin suppressor-like RCC1 family protein